STGITRTQTSVSSFGLNDNMKFTSQGGKNAWNTSQYLNIWVCNLGGGLLGYAYQPGTSAANVDGVVLGYFTLPGGVGAPFNEGRTATHEIGHYFNLDHIWGPGNGGNCASDLVADTPPQNYPNYDCPTFPSPSCNNQGDMHMNYMDYVNDACMYMFTTGQKTRMQAAISASRGGLLTSQGCVPVVLPALDIALTSIVSPTATVPSGALAPQVIIKNAGQNIITTATIAYSIDNGPSVSYTWNGNLASQATATVSLPATTISAGVHNIVVTTTMAGDANATNNTSSRSFNAISSSGQAQSFEGTFPPTNYGVTGTTANYRWQQTSLAAKTGANSMFVDNYDINAPGNRTDLTLPATNLSSFSNVQLTFAVAHKMYSQTTSNPDSLEVLISTNGGQTYTSIYKKGGVSLATGSGSSTTSEYVPALASDWRTETISLTPYNSSTNSLFYFFNFLSF
ncbi:MAG: zinc metalloprotease, partial [Sphingobacteriales bacterium]